MAEGNEGRAIYPSLRGKKVLVTGGGSGLGLAMAKALVEKNKGQLRVESEVGKHR